MADVTPFDVLGAGAGGPLAPPTPWLQQVGYISYPGAVVIGSPTGLGQGVGTLNVQTLFINGAPINLSLYFPYTGGTLTGMLTLFADPTAALHAATKQYVDAKVNANFSNFANYLPLVGGTLTGPLILSGDPTVNLNAATKQYVDNKFTGLIAVPDAPSDGTNYGRGGPVGGPNIWMNTFDPGTY
jgi:hypothetical protein